MLYDLFRTQFVVYTCYTTIIQFLQCQYQQGCLYRLRSLGERYDMDLTTEGEQPVPAFFSSFCVPSYVHCPKVASLCCIVRYTVA